jgi:hypothetical protein
MLASPVPPWSRQNSDGPHDIAPHASPASPPASPQVKVTWEADHRFELSQSHSVTLSSYLPPEQADGGSLQKSPGVHAAVSFTGGHGEAVESSSRQALAHASADAIAMGRK